MRTAWRGLPLELPRKGAANNAIRPFNCDPGFADRPLCGAEQDTRGQDQDGVLQDLPEPYASAAGNGGIVAAQLAASDVEKEYLEGDAEILPDTSEGGIGAELDRVREWIEKEHVAAVVSSANTAVNEQIARMVEARHRTLLITGDGADWTDRPCSPSVIVWGTGRAARIRALAQVSASQNKNRWYLVADQNPSGVASEAASRNALASVGGQVVGTTERVVGSRDFTDTISAVDKTNAELVV